MLIKNMMMTMMMMVKQTLTLLLVKVMSVQNTITCFIAGNSNIITKQMLLLLQAKATLAQNSHLFQYRQ